MRTIATLALFAVANAVRVQDSNVPWRTDFPTPDECKWLLNDQDETTATQRIEDRAALWNIGLWYCEREDVIACWTQTDAEVNVASAGTQ